jgi:hypothetical protein
MPASGAASAGTVQQKKINRVIVFESSALISELLAAWTPQTKIHVEILPCRAAYAMNECLSMLRLGDMSGPFADSSGSR